MASKPLKTGILDSTKPWYGPNTIMLNHKFDRERMRRWTIWAARWRECPRCSRPAYSPCANLVDRKNDKVPGGMERDTRWPHTERVDYDLLVKGLKYRGYE